MKSNCQQKVTFLFIVLVLLMSSQTFGQRTVAVTPGIGTLDKAILGDTTATGARVDPNTVYVLQRGGYYLTTGTIENRFPLTVVAAVGIGPRPIVQPAVGAGGTSSNSFSPRADLTLRGLYITNKDNSGVVAGLSRLMRTRADKIRLVFDDCHLDQSGQSALRIDSKNIRIYFTNSIVSNIGTTIDPNNGRAFDDRGNNIDTLVIENCTFYNLTSTVLRDGGGWIKYFRFNHNTTVNTGQRGLDVGEAVTVKFTNNLFINTGVLGNTPWIEPPFRVVFLVDSLLTKVIDGVPVTQSVLISNLNIYTDPAIDAAQGDSATVIPNFNATAQAFINTAGTGNTIINEPIKFTNGPAVPTNVVTTFYANPNNTPPYDDGGKPLGVMPFDFRYSTTTQSYTAGTAGKPLGAIIWFGMYNEVKRETSTIPQNFELYANYPNPFNPTTNIRYSIPVQNHVSLTIYNLLGQKVATLVDQVQQSGTYTANWNGTSDNGLVVSSGLYFYRIEAGNFITTKKMVLLK
ncbi:MAG: T9SS type A sorting domain-containing protein [Bacteroidetes bacterium]|nr:T9SS type A sorting domain-containing protein [Bacteroidota bacterium]